MAGETMTGDSQAPTAFFGSSERSLMLDAAHKQAIIPGGNGVFQWTIVRAGRVIGTWKRTVGRRQTTIKVYPLVPLGAADRAEVETAFEPYGVFVGQPLRVDWP